MRVKQQSLIPRVQYAEETDLCTEMAGIGGHVEQCLGACMEEQVEDSLFVLQGEGRQFARQREDGMHVARRQQLPFPCCEPAQAGVALALGAIPVTTRVVRDGHVTTV